MSSVALQWPRASLGQTATFLTIQKYCHCLLNTMEFASSLLEASRDLNENYLAFQSITRLPRANGMKSVCCCTRTKLRYRFCKVQTAASAVGCGWMWSEKLNKRKSDGGMTGDVCYRICNQMYFQEQVLVKKWLS